MASCRITAICRRMGLNTGYLSTNRGIIKIIQIAIGFIVCSLLCSAWHGGRSCFGEGRLGFCSGLNFVVLIVNIVLFVLNFITIAVWNLERIYSTVCTILFLIASILIIWFILDMHTSRTFLILSAICMVVEFLLFLWDVKILHGEAPNY
ncbi:hypothetical protein AB6A40_003120 [Gnathostoma spinigerum]|uniref:MARVEL domain-containing protein n=1 Tax=Gnathostoma spinigerum TaxID=75299 RepID=A0ABD6EB38_9BILA